MQIGRGTEDEGSKESPPVREPVPRLDSYVRIAAAVQELVDYSWESEARDFSVSYADCGESHIFVTMCSLEQWLSGKDEDLAEYHDPLEEDDDEEDEEDEAAAGEAPTIKEERMSDLVAPDVQLVVRLPNSLKERLRQACFGQLGFVVGSLYGESWVRAERNGLSWQCIEASITADGFVIATAWATKGEGDREVRGHHDFFLGSVSDLERNIREVLVHVNASPEETAAFFWEQAAQIRDWRRNGDRWRLT
jgi:hypothetical protein